jgi:hypothetical protein
MSQTSGEPGHDPEKDEWLKQFSGIPESYDPEDLRNDRPYFDDLMKERPGAGFIEGQLESLGDAAADIKERYGRDHPPHRRPPISRIAYVVLVVLALWVAMVHYLPF